MDNKTAFVPKYNPKNVVQNYITPQKMDYSIIDNIYNIFTTDEYDKINEKLQSNEILNFRTEKGETLIHAILRNPSSTLKEFQIKKIIENLIHKNVSINAMNEYNQTAMHLAAKRGYYDIIKYLIGKKCDYNTIDNYGNAPLHYLLDNFVSECIQNEYYNESNIKIKKSKSSTFSTNNQYDYIVENLLLKNLINIIDNYKRTDPNGYINKCFDNILAMVDSYKYYSIDNINSIIEQKNIDINNLYINFNTSNILNIKNELNKIIDTSIKDFESIYKNFDVDLKNLSINTITDITISVENNKIKILKDLITKMNIIKDNILIIKNKLVEINKIYFSQILRIIYIIYYIKYSIPYVLDAKYQVVGNQYNIIKSRNKINNIIDNIIQKYFNKDIHFIQHYDNQINTSNIYNQEDILLELFDRKPDNYIENSANPAELLELSINKNDLQEELLVRFENQNEIDNWLNTNPNFEHENINLNIIYTNERITSNYKYSNIHNILIYIQKNLDNLDNNVDISTFKMALCYINNNHCKLINILANIPILNKELNSINYEELFKNCDKLSDFLITESIDNYNFLFSQISKPEFQTNKSNNFTTYFKQDFINNKINISNHINDLYNDIQKIIKFNLELNDSINAYYANIYLINYIKYLDNPNHEIIENYFFNNFNDHKYLFSINNLDALSSNFTAFNNKYYLLNKKIDISALKNNLLIFNFDYDFNIIYSNLNFNKSKNKIPYFLVNIDIIQHIFTIEKRLFTIPISPTNEYNIGFTLFGYNDNLLQSKNQLSIYSKTTNDFTQLTRNDSKIYSYIQIKENYNINDNYIPIIALKNIGELIQLIIIKIITVLKTDNRLVEIIINTINDINLNDNYNLPNKLKKSLIKTFDIIQKDPELLLKIVLEKLIIYIKTLLEVQINNQVFKLIELINQILITNPILISNSIKSDELIDINKFKKLSKINVDTYLKKMLNDNKSITNLTQILNNLDTTKLIGIENKKLLLNKCVNTTSLELLKDLKFNFRILDKNGNTIINRLIDQYNIYAINKILLIDKNIITYKNNRGQDSLTYLYNTINIINANYKEDQITLRFLEYENNLGNMIEHNPIVNEFILDKDLNIIQHIIRYSIYVFNEFLWLKMLACPDGWQYYNKENLKKNNFK